MFRVSENSIVKEQSNGQMVDMQNNNRGGYAAGVTLPSSADQVDFEFFLQNYCRHANEKGSLYTWGSGEMGQLGYSSRIIS